MKNYIIPILLGFAAFIACNPAIESKEEKPNLEESVLAFDSIKAQAYGADDYGMKKYVIAFLKRGPNRSLDKDSAASLQNAHMANIGKMAEAGKLVLAGPFYGNDDLRGLYVFNVQSIAEAEALTNTDPAIIAGSLEMELKEWYGSAALMAINEIHTSIAKVEM